MRAEVESLLSVDAGAGSFLEHPPIGSTEPAIEDGGPLVGARVGAYQLVRHLGAGGMGTVYLARRADGHFEHEVAVKLLKRGMDSDAILRRFHAERQILAALDHPNICRLLDGGVTDDGVPYFVMESIDGEPIDVHCRRLGLPLARRLELFLAVCEAVKYAHANLVVHRDLKPRNVLVSRSGSVKLVDFGIAKLLAPGAEATAAAERLMTPAYASPEQLRGGPITTATDVHALGLLLYELLAERRPFAGLEGVELERAVLEREPPPLGGAVPPRFRRAVRGDLENIVALALRKDPARRYPSAGELAADVVRHLRSEPVRARKDATLYRAGKFIGRHRVGVAAAAAVALSLGAATAIAVHQAAVAARQRDIAAAERDKAREVSAFLTGLFDVDPLGDDEQLSDQTTLREFLGRREAKVRGELDDRPEIKATLLEHLCRFENNLGRSETAKALCAEALAAGERAGLGEALRAEILNSLASAEQDQGDFAAAEAHFRRALALREASFAPDSAEVGESVNNLVVELNYAGAKETLAEREALARRGLAIRLARFGPDHSDTAQSLNSLGAVLVGRGDLAGAADLWQQALAIRARRLGEHHPLVATLRINVGYALRESGHLPEAIAAFRAAAEDLAAKLGPEHPRVAAALYGLYKTLAKSGDRAGAEAALRRALAIDEKTLPPGAPQLEADRKELAELVGK